MSPEASTPEASTPESSTARQDEPMAAEGQPAAAAAVDDIVGYIDGIGVRRISGWTVDRSRLDERLFVRVRLDGEVIGEGRADQPRPDLERNGMGDGTYGFDIEPVRPIPQSDYIKITASASRTEADAAAPIPLENLIARKLAAESPGQGFAAITSQLQQALDESRALQRRTDHALRLIGAELKDMRERTESLPSRPAQVDADASLPDANLPDAIAGIRATQAELTRQLGEVAVIQARIDASLVAIRDSGSGAAGGGDDRTLRRLVTVLTGVSGVAVGLGVLSLFV